MATKRLASKPIETKPITSFAAALRARKAFLEETDRDPQYQALRLRGLAGLIRESEQGLYEVANLHETAFSLATTLDDIAECLSPDVDWSRS